MATYCLDLEKSSSQYAYKADSATTSITGNLTIEGWIKLETLASVLTTDETLIGKWDSQASYKLAIYTATDKLTFIYSSDGTTNVGSLTKFECDTAFGAGDLATWIHTAVAVDVSGKTAYFYLNGSPVANTKTIDAATAIYDGNANFDLGCNYSLSGALQFFDGKLFDMRLWNDIRTAQEVADNYNKRLVGTEAGLVGYWKLNNNYLDTTSNDLDLTASGSPVFAVDSPFNDAEASSNFLPLL